MHTSSAGAIAAVVQLARSQGGLVTTRQCVTLGVSKRQIEGHVERYLLFRERRGVYRLPGVASTPTTKIAAAVLVAGPGAVASHRSAAVLWELDRFAASDEVVVTCPRQLRLPDVRTVHRSLPAWQRTWRDGLRVTTPERTVFDLASTMPEATLGEWVDDGRRRKLIRLDRLRRLGWEYPLSPALRAVLAERTEGDAGANEWERRMDRLWEELGLPPATRQFRTCVEGRLVIIDRAIVAERIAVEWNGYGHHGTLAGFHSDSHRRAALTRAGWHMLDFTFRSTPKEIRDTVLATVAQRRGDLGAPPSAAEPPGRPGPSRRRPAQPLSYDGPGVARTASSTEGRAVVGTPAAAR